MSPAFLGQQIDSVFTDIRPDAVKIGMVASSGLIEVVAERLQHYAATNIVVDPVMVATSGARLISEDAIATLEARLLPLATVLTPNIPEAEVLSGLTIASPDDIEQEAGFSPGDAPATKGSSALSSMKGLGCCRAPTPGPSWSWTPAARVPLTSV